ncbi:MAG: hypothetical protein GX934_16510 [Burkholderiales bacterium]|jgi:MoaA/NifB/PqqE/SkfB family radical SAM enzyme|nr:hypothetical protein [Burkholderiales bacterium]
MMDRPQTSSLSIRLEKLKRSRLGQAAVRLSVRLGLNKAIRHVLFQATSRVLADNPVCLDQIEDGLLRIRITNLCNAQCRYCGLRSWSKEEQQRSMEPKWFYEYCRPLYEKLKIVLITGGDAFVARESFNYMKFLSENYPQVTVMTESNGQAFSERFQELACQNLFITHFSLNASCPEVFQKGCWAGKPGETAYLKALDNLWTYKALLESRGLDVFGPSVSMVINKDTAHDVIDFIKLALKLNARCASFFFDYTESDMAGSSFGQPETSRPALKTLMELERVLARRFFIYFRLWLPFAEAAPLQEEVEATPLAELQEKHREVLDLARDRSMSEELRQRNEIRAQRGKKVILFEEAWTPTIRMIEVCGKQVCFAPWKEIDLYPNGRLDFCGWYKETLNLRDFIENDSVDWSRILNSPEFRTIRNNIWNYCFDGCQTCCPMNNCTSPVIPIHKYGFDRIEAGA